MSVFRMCMSMRARLSVAALLFALQGVAAAAGGYRFEVLFEFEVGIGVPGFPTGELVEAPEGGFFGTTMKGGPDFDLGGSVFHLTKTGNQTVFHYFTPETEYFPNGVILAKDGNLYGTTQGGGNGDSAGVIFGLTPSGYEVLHRFEAATGYNPHRAPTQGRDGHLYGATRQGGRYHCGVFYRLTLPDLVYTVLAHFGHGHGGCGPTTQVIQGDDGAYYGTTSRYGPNRGGTVFRFDPRLRQRGLTILHSFDGEDGASPFLSFQGKDGFLYGQAARGGDSDGGIAFKISPSGRFVLLHSYGSGSEGNYPLGLTPRVDGLSFGATHYGGANGQGTIYGVSPEDQAVTVIQDLGAKAGWIPNLMTVDSHGVVYGTTSIGGKRGGGVMFRLAPLK